MYPIILAKLSKLATVFSAAIIILDTGMISPHFETPDVGTFAHVRVGQTKTISVGIYQITQHQWRVCYQKKGCSYLPKSYLEIGEIDYPVVGLNRFDVNDYLRWINRRTGRTYRLPTAEEWNVISEGLSRRPTKKLFSDPRMAWAADYGTMESVSKKVQRSGSFGTNKFGIADFAGNVWEWTSTCANGSINDVDCPAYVVDGLHEAVVSIFIRNPATGGCAAGVPPANIGFRLAAND